MPIIAFINSVLNPLNTEVTIISIETDIKIPTKFKTVLKEGRF